MTDLDDYINSERFIHDELCHRAASAVAAIPGIMERYQYIEPNLLLWPSEPLKTKEGASHDRIIYHTLPKDPAEMTKAIKNAVRATKPYALLLVEQQGVFVRAIFESRHGSCAWTLPIKNHGDVLVLEPPEVTRNKQCIGVLWRPNKAHG